MSDPLGLFEGSGGDDPLGLFDKEDAFAKIPGGYVKPPKPKEHTWDEMLVGGAEAAYGAARGFIGGIDAPIRGALTGLFGKGDSEKAANKAMDEWAYQPTTDAGQEYLHNVGEVANKYLIPMAGVYIPTAKLPKELRGKGLREDVGANLDRIEPKPVDADPLGLFKEQAPEAAPVKDFYTPSQLKFQKEAIDAHNKVLADRAAAEAELQRSNSAQAAIEARQAALEEQVKRQTQLDMNAAERARQEAAPVPGLEEARAREIQDSINRTQELNQKGQQMGIVEDFGNNDPMARMPEMRVDENGMPIRADLSMEAQNLENPLQRNLWGDELGPALDQERSMTDAMDIMPPWERPSDHVGRELQADAELQAKMDESIRQAAESGDFPRTVAQLTVEPKLPTNDRPTSIGRGYRGKQSGAMDPGLINDIAEGIQKLVRGFDKFDLPITSRDAMDKIHPSIKGAIKDYIPKPDNLEVSKAKILSEKDGPDLVKSLQSGAINTADKVRSTLIQQVGRMNLYAQKVADRTIRQRIEPMEKDFRKLSTNERVATHQVLTREMFQERRYTDQELRTAGMSEKAIAAYKTLRDNFDHALNNLNEGRAARGKAPITPKEAYLASRWSGDWHIPLYDAEGKLVWYIRENSKMGAKKALDWLKENKPEGIDWKRAEITNRKSATDPNSPRDVASAYKELLDLMDESDPRVQEMKNLYEQLQQNDAYDFMNTKKHFLQKSNVHGFIGDQPWKSPERQANDLFTSQFQYLKEAERWSETQKVMEDIKEFLADPDIQAAQPNNVRYAQLHMQNALGFGVNRALASIEGDLAKFLGVSRSDLYKATNASKSLFYFNVLSGSPGYVISSLLQPAFGLAAHRALTLGGMNHNVAKTTVMALYDTALGVLQHLEGSRAELPLSKLGQEALRYAEENGLVSHDIFDVNESVGANRAVQLGKAALGGTISFPEKVGRLTTFMSIVHHLDQSGKFSKMDLFQKAEDMTNTVMVDFRRSERAMLFNQLGVLGENAAPLKSFIFSYYNQLSKYARMAANGSPTPLIAFLGAQYMLGGLINLPGMNEVEGAWDQVKNALAKLSPKGYAKVMDMPGPKEAAASHLPDWLSYGPLSERTGVDFSTRASTAIVDPNRPFQDMFPMGQVWDMGMNAANLALNPNQTTAAQAAWTLGNPVVKGNLETRMDAFKARNLETGEPLVDDEGKKQYLKPSKLAKQEATGPRRDEHQEDLRKWGLRDLGEARERDINFTARNNEFRNKTARATTMDKGFDALVRGDKEAAKEYWQLYAAKFDGADTLESDFTQKLMAYVASPETRQKMRNAGMDVIMSIKRRQDALKGNQ